MPEEPAPKRHSFLDPVGDFARDSIFRPQSPFELVPGKDPNRWGFVIAPYLWAMGLDGRTGVRGMPPAGISNNAAKVLQQLDWGVMGMAEVRKGRWGLLADGFYAELSGSSDLGGVLYKSGSMNVQQGLASLSLAFRIIDDRRGFLDLYAGARYNYLGTQVTANPDTGGIQQLSTAMTDRIGDRINAKVETKVRALQAQIRAGAARARAIAAELKESVRSELAGHALESAAGDQHRAVEAAMLRELRERGLGPEGIADRTNRELRRAGIDPDRVHALRRFFSADRQGVIDDYIRATVDLEVARARGEATEELEQRVAGTKSKAARSLAEDIEDALPTGGNGDAWWVDPIVGFRGQINFTRWLYLTSQADVGGFGAGSQIAWNVIGALGVNFTRNLFAELGYRYMYVDYQNSNLLYQMNSYGIYSSIGLKF